MIDGLSKGAGGIERPEVDPVRESSSAGWRGRKVSNSIRTFVSSCWSVGERR